MGRAGPLVARWAGGVGVGLGGVGVGLLGFVEWSSPKHDSPNY
jgi:hypothetical protein